MTEEALILSLEWLENSLEVVQKYTVQTKIICSVVPRDTCAVVRIVWSAGMGSANERHCGGLVNKWNDRDKVECDFQEEDV